MVVASFNKWCIRWKLMISSFCILIDDSPFEFQYHHFAPTSGSICSGILLVFFRQNSLQQNQTQIPPSPKWVVEPEALCWLWVVIHCLIVSRISGDMDGYGRRPNAMIYNIPHCSNHKVTKLKKTRSLNPNLPWKRACKELWNEPSHNILLNA